MAGFVAIQPFANNSLELSAEDTGQMKSTQNEADRGKFKMPSLRKSALTAPYMHDGQFGTLEEVVERYSTGACRSATLDPKLAMHLVAEIQSSEQAKAT
jgi:cytochrome c peroxidase